MTTKKKKPKMTTKQIIQSSFANFGIEPLYDIRCSRKYNYELFLTMLAETIDSLIAGIDQCIDARLRVMTMAFAKIFRHAISLLSSHNFDYYAVAMIRLTFNECFQEEFNVCMSYCCFFEHDKKLIHFMCEVEKRLFYQLMEGNLIKYFN